MTWSNEKECQDRLASFAVQALVEEAELAPKPGLVDPEDSGAHTDLTFDLMVHSAFSLRETFQSIAKVSYLQEPDQALREQIACIGRAGEKEMFQATSGINTHKGAIWTLGLLTAGAALNKVDANIERVIQTASMIASYPDRYNPNLATHGSQIREKYGVKGAKGEAESGFPHLTNVALPALETSRENGVPEPLARLNALVSLIAHLDDTCVIHRGGVVALKLAKQKASDVINVGGVSTQLGWGKLVELNRVLVEHNASPGGSADLLAAALFLDQLRSVNPIGSKTLSII